MAIITFNQIQLFLSLFKGRNDIYARRWEKDGKSGYSPAYDVDWTEYRAFKAKGGKFSDFPNKKPLLLTTEVIQDHLNGTQTIGIYPLLTDNTSHFIAADFDKENWQEESKAFTSFCNEHEIPAHLERSRSGKGAHVWIFFKEKYPANRSRAIMFELIRKALKLSEFEKEVSFDRLFPNQDYHTNQGMGNLIALPLHGTSIISENTVFLHPKTLEVIPDQWFYLKGIQKMSIQQLDKLYETFVVDSRTISIGTDSLKTDSNSSKQFTILIENTIKLPKVRLKPQLVKFLRDKLNFFNTEYLVKEKMGISTYQTEKYFKLISEAGEYVLLPRGFFNQLIAFCKEQNLSYTVIDKRNLQKEIAFKPKITLYEYQRAALEDIADQEYGVIVAPSGAGKTILGLKLVADKSQPTLILVHRKQLLDQWIERIESFLGIPKKDIGQISGNKKTIGKEITVAMMQSLIKMEGEEKEKVTNAFGTIIIDECHHIPAKTFRELITQFNPYYLYGLTATPKRKYNDEKLIYYYIGEILTTIDPNKTIKSKQIKDGKHTVVEIHETSLTVPFDHKTDTFEVLSKVLIYDSNRNMLITQAILKHVMGGKKILVLTERKEHVEVINLYLKSHCEIITLTGEDSASKRRLKLEQLNLGHFQVLIATGQLLGEGLDLPVLDCIFLVYPFSFEGKLTQYIGRIQRTKNQKFIVDYNDSNIAFFEKLFKKRSTYYRKNGWL